MIILLLGKDGQIGWELQRSLAPLGNVIALGHHDLDLSHFDAIRQCIRELKPQLIVNAAAYTAVDQAEREPDLARMINSEAPGILAEEAARCSAALVHYSTDYVFGGNHSTSYTEADQPNPLNVYGQTKLVGEFAIQQVGVPHLILRTSWIYGMRGKNFLLTILRLAREKPELKIVCDQVGAPTWSRMIAAATAQILVQCCDHTVSKTFDPTKGGTYHLTAAGETSWFGFAQAILEQGALAHTVQLSPIPTSQYPTPAQRPAYSILNNEKVKRTFSIQLPDWRSQLHLIDY